MNPKCDVFFGGNKIWINIKFSLLLPSFYSYRYSKFAQAIYLALDLLFFNSIDLNFSLALSCSIRKSKGKLTAIAFNIETFAITIYGISISNELI